MITDGEDGILFNFMVSLSNGVVLEFMIRTRYALTHFTQFVRLDPYTVRIIVKSTIATHDIRCRIFRTCMPLRNILPDDETGCRMILGGRDTRVKL